MFENTGWRKATTADERVYEAAQYFTSHRNGSPVQVATLTEAFTTSDFPRLLASAFTAKALERQKTVTPEFDSVVYKTTAPDFTERPLVDLWSGDAFERVHEGEEYRAGTLTETTVKHRTAKWGRVYGLTYELRRSGDFGRLADFPALLANAEVRAKNQAVANALTKDGAWDGEFFGAVDNKPLNADNLKAAIKQLASTEDHRGDLVETSNLVLVVGPGLAQTARDLINVDRLTVSSDANGKTTKVETANPFKGLVTVVESRALGAALGDNQATAWALLQGASSTLPSLIQTGLAGAEGIDIRVRNDQGTSVTGGTIGADEGSFNDDTIWYRGRSFFNIDRGFREGVYASTGK